MIIVGMLATKEEVDKITAIAKFVTVGWRFRELGKQVYGNNELDKLIEEVGDENNK